MKDHDQQGHGVIPLRPQQQALARSVEVLQQALSWLKSLHHRPDECNYEIFYCEMLIQKALDKLALSQARADRRRK